MISKIIALANQKGGVGKTTSTINIGAFLAEMNLKILIIDIDPQGNSGSGLGLDIMSVKTNMYDWLLDRADASSAIQKTNIANLEIIPSNIDLSGLEVDLRDAPEKDYVLKKKLDALKNQYDFILIDCPPSLGLLTINALTSADTVLIPLQCEYFALEGLSQLLRIIKLVQEKMNTELKIEGVLLTMYDSRTKLSAQVVQDVREHFGKDVYEIIIPRNVKLSEAPSFGEPIGIYDGSSAGAIAYRKLSKEILEKNVR